MDENYILLAIASMELTITRFLSPDVPRIDADVAGSVVYTASGNTVIQGTQYQQWALWNISAYLPLDEARLLQRIYFESDRRRRLQLDPGVLIHDRTFPRISRTATDRQVVAGTTPVNITPYWQFYAVFKGVFTSAPTYTESARGFNVNFTLQETEPT